MLKAIYNHLFRVRAKKFLSETPRMRRFVNYNKSQNVLLLFESDALERNENIRQMIAQLKQDGKKVSAWGYLNKKEVSTSILPEFRILHHKQTDFSGKPDDSFLNELAGQEFDLLIDLSLKRVLTLEYIALYAKASCKAGIRKNDLPVYDFVLDIENQVAESSALHIEGQEATKIDENYLFDQIIFYLKRIQTND